MRHWLRNGLTALSLITPLWCASSSAVQGPQAKGGELRAHKFVALRMGTEFQIQIYSTDALSAQKASLAAFDRVEELEDIMSDYRERSEVMRLCRAPAGIPQAVSPELFFVLDAALRISRLSGGAFDATIGPVVQIWREARKKKQLPDPADIKRARQLVGFNNVVLDPAERTVTLKLPKMRIDLGGIGKGYAADEALRVLVARGFRRALVQAGGEIVVGDAPPGRAGWKIRIRKPDSTDPKAPAYLLLDHKGVSTSGDSFQYLEVNGQRYSHIINPGDGMGLRNSPEVTVVARDGISADALSTALDIMPIPEGLKLVEMIEGASAVITRTSPTGSEHFYSRGFPNYPGEVTKNTRTTEHKGNQ